MARIKIILFWFLFFAGALIVLVLVSLQHWLVWSFESWFEVVRANLKVYRQKIEERL